MKRSSFLVSLITFGSVGIDARATIVPIVRQSEVLVQGNVGDKAFNHSTDTQGVTGWSGDAVGYVDNGVANASKQYSTASAGQGSAFAFDHGNLSKVALEMASDAAQRGGSVSGTSRFDLTFVVTETPVEFHAWGSLDSQPENSLAFRLRNTGDTPAFFANNMTMDVDSVGQFDHSGMLAPGQYELTAVSVVRAMSDQGSGTGLEATIEFSSPTPTAVPLPAVMNSAAGLCSIALTLFSGLRYARRSRGTH